ncbi:hypothetical protein DPMN_047174 [Dreissena polymorpha]|uniref:Uncharacterized protein n=1 Tax=Dreissena polymorpha TaxID=45954 RepID=A0A9D4I192_DREPO|nr:hypothetical protein DPMN_047174 [Dreissena polymorpha]
MLPDSQPVLSFSTWNWLSRHNDIPVAKNAIGEGRATTSIVLWSSERPERDQKHDIPHPRQMLFNLCHRFIKSE